MEVAMSISRSPLLFTLAWVCTLAAVAAQPRPAPAPERKLPTETRPVGSTGKDKLPPGGSEAPGFDCIEPDPPKVPPLGAKSRVAAEPSTTVLSSLPGLLVKSGGRSHLSFEGAKLAAGSRPAQPLFGPCGEVAWDAFFDHLHGPHSFPDFHFPDQPCNDLPRCAEAREAWMRAHYYTFMARQVIHLIANAEDDLEREYLWKQPGRGKDGKPLSSRTSPQHWFGAWSKKRFLTVKDGMDQLWEVLTTAKTGGISIQLRCPTKLTNPGNVCVTVKPGAHHIVKGKVDLCDSFFGQNRTDADRGRLVAHELLHHRWLEYGNGWVAVQDKHYHGHDIGCGQNPVIDKSYGEAKILHLAEYRNSKGNDCGHLARNVRNNDTYAQFVTAIGDAVYRGDLVEWPMPADPTPKPPTCVGDENCLCEGISTWPANKPFVPDGDWKAQGWCADNDGEMTCVETKFGIQVVGICKKCQLERGPGCECDSQRHCEVGACFGADTFGGGVGHCFLTPPPSWACLVDCKRLFNSEQAWCYSDYPTGRARCMDVFCDAPEADACAQQGGVCQEGKCKSECSDTAQCKAKGYPESFECKAGRCEYHSATE
jgi:hypothetical protein